MLETYSRRDNMEKMMIEHCAYLFRRTQQNVNDCVELAQRMHNQGLKDLQKSVQLVKQHRNDTKRMFSINRLADLKHSQVPPP